MHDLMKRREEVVERLADITGVMLGPLVYSPLLDVLLDLTRAALDGNKEIESDLRKQHLGPELLEAASDYVDAHEECSRAAAQN
jgi:hypothetical protein